jgi:hypothetical protein
MALVIHHNITGHQPADFLWIVLTPEKTAELLFRSLERGWVWDEIGHARIMPVRSQLAKHPDFSSNAHRDCPPAGMRVQKGEPLRE